VKEVVLEAGGLLRGSSAPALEPVQRRQPGIHHVEANAVSQTETVGYDETATSEAEIRRLIEECGYHCRGEVRPRHLCAPELEVAVPSQPLASTTGHAGHAPAQGVQAPSPQPSPDGTVAARGAQGTVPPDHAGHVMPAAGTVRGEMAQMAHEMGHGAGMSMEAMVRDMRNRFIVAFILAIPIVLYSPLATELAGIRLPVPFGGYRP
jgi:Cu2+-exporting ATPase